MILRQWMLRVGGILLVGTLLGTLLGALLNSGHDPNHGIDQEQARAAAGRVHATPKPGEKRMPGAGG